MSVHTLRRNPSTSPAAEHAEWLGLIDVSGPFLSVKVLLEAFPQGLDADEPGLAGDLRRRLGEWHDNNEARKPDYGIHDTFIRFVLGDILEIRPKLLQEGPAIPPTARAALPEHRVTLAPKFAVGQSGAEPALLISVHPPATGLEKALPEKGFHASPVERMRLLLRHTGIQSGLVTNGEKWTLVHAPADRTATFATWDANDLLDERLTFRAFRSLLGKTRLLDHPSEDTLAGLLERSRDDEREVTDQLGLQVRRAVELLVTALDKADHERGGAVVKAVRRLDRNEPAERTIYEAIVAVCMRLIFLLAAEARGLLPDDEPWLESYAVGTLRADLQTIADRSGEELLDRRFDAWPRLLATFRAVHSGVEHDRVRLPGYGGGLFDPDRYPFLEDAEGVAPRISNRVILRVLDALQTLEVHVPGGGRERRPLSYRALGVEQVGHVYERLLDHTAVRADHPSLGLVGTAKKEPELAIKLLDHERAKSEAVLLDFLVEETGRSRSALKRALDKTPQPDRAAALAQACQRDPELIMAATPYLELIRDDAYGVPTIFLPGSIYVTESEQRAATGTYYTPPSLTQPIVEYALEPVVYCGPADGISREHWTLKQPSELLELKVCDIAMGSAAFLVAACRYLAARLVEAWEIYPGEAPPDAGADPEERDLTARRIVAERCLYGVDVNPLAVDIAKVSLWLTTLRRDRPFTFVDHALRHGDSLLGLTSVEELEALTLRPEEARSVLLEDAREAIRATLSEVRQVREQIEATDAIDLREAEEKARALLDADRRLYALKVVGDLVVGTSLEEAAHKGNASTAVEAASAAICDALTVTDAAERNVRVGAFAARAVEALMAGRAPGASNPPKPFHWVLEFPEVFQRVDPGFDAIVGNPPFLGGKKLSGVVGAGYREYLVNFIASLRRGNADLVAFFFLRAASLLSSEGTFGLVATNTIAQGDTREVGLDAMIADGWRIYGGVKSAAWPGEAALAVSHVWASRTGRNNLSSSLDPATRTQGAPVGLATNASVAFQGYLILGDAFFLSPDDAHDLREAEPEARRLVHVCLNAEDLQNLPDQTPQRFALDFGTRSAAEISKFPVTIARLGPRIESDRETRDSSAYPGLQERWWQYWRPRPELRDAIGARPRVLVGPQTAKWWAVAFVPPDWVFTHALNVFALEDGGHAAVLSSTLHDAWARRYSGSLETRLRYSPSDCFQSFPFPEDVSSLDEIGEHYLNYRKETLLSTGQGLTQIYNHVHEQPEDTTEPIEELRRLRRELDRAVTDAYGWTDTDLVHDFRETPLGLRYTISDVTKTEILDRLLELNHTQHAQEVTQGLHDKPKRKRLTKRSSVQTPASSDRLFD
jgi:hypothetical protein